MTGLRTAAQRVLDEYDNDSVGFKLFGALEDLRAALAEPVQEPVAWMLTENEKYGNSVVLRKHKPKTYDSDWWTVTPLYTAPPQRKPLTEEEIEEINRDLPLLHMQARKGSVAVVFARAIEQAHGIGVKE